MGNYKVFKDLGLHASVPEGFKNIRVHLVYNCRHDGRYRARMVADGYLTDIPVDSVYSGVVSLRRFIMQLFLTELNGLKIWGIDISSAYLENFTKEKCCILAGNEFGPLKDQRLVISKSLYGLQSSPQRWHNRFLECMKLEGFKPFKWRQTFG